MTRDQDPRPAAAEPTLFDEGAGVTRVDLRWRGMPGQIASYLLSDGGALAVVEPGPGRTLPTLLAALERLGHVPRYVTHNLVTHVHLDHAGAAGELATLAPGASVYVHPLGARHLVDPTRLFGSAQRIYGDRMEELWGSMLPLPQERLRVLTDEARVTIGGRTLVALDTPGHAVHHHAFFDPDERVVFGGDVTGIRLSGAAYVRPPTPPPDIDVARWLASIARIRALRPDRVLPTHFGGVADAGWHLDQLEARLRDWAAWAEERVAAGDDLAAMSGALAAKAHAEVVSALGSEAAAIDYEEAVPSPMLAAGLHRWASRHRAEQA